MKKKIKDVKPILDVLPERDKKRRVDSGYELIRQGKNSMISYVRNTELPDCNEYVQIDVNKLKRHFVRMANKMNWEKVSSDNMEEEMPYSMLHCFEAIQESNLLEYKKD